MNKAQTQHARGVCCAKLESEMLAGQVLGRNLEALATRAQELKEQWRDQFVSVEHLVLALVDDARFGKRTLEAEGLTKAKLENAIKEMRGNNRVTDQVRLLLSSHHSVMSQLLGLCTWPGWDLLSPVLRTITKGTRQTACLGFPVKHKGVTTNARSGTCKRRGWDFS